MNKTNQQVAVDFVNKTIGEVDDLLKKATQQEELQEPQEEYGIDEAIQCMRDELQSKFPLLWKSFTTKFHSKS